MTSSAQGKRDEATWEAAKKSMKFFGSGYLDIAAAEVHDQQIVQFTKGAEFGYSLARNEARGLVDVCKRQMASDDACGHPFNEDMSEALQAYEKGEA